MLRPLTQKTALLSRGALYGAARQLATAARLSFQDAVESAPVARVSRLGNGLRVATEATDSDVATVAVLVEAGSRFEKEVGAANMLEHTLLKGAGGRNQPAIEAEIEALGGSINIVTGRETTAIYATTPASNAAKALSLLADCVQHPTVSDEALAASRDVALREMASIDGSQMDLVVLNHLHATAYQGHPLARAPIGTSKAAQTIGRQHVLDYHRANFRANRMVVAAAGSVNHEEIAKVAEQSFGALGQALNAGVAHPRFIGSEIRHRDDEMPFAHVGLAFEGYGWTHPDYFSLQVATTLFGSWNKSLAKANNLASPLAQQCSSEDICETYTHFNHGHTDTGLVGVYFVADRFTVDDALHEIQSEWMRLAVGAADNEVARAKAALKYRLISSLSSSAAVADDLGRQVLALGRRMPLAEAVARIDAVDAPSVRRCISQVMVDKDPAVVGVGPVEALPDYNRIMSGQWWARL